MKKYILFILIVVFNFSSYSQTSAEAIINNLVAQYKKAGSVSADIYISSASQGSTKGNFVMKGNCFRYISRDIKTWFNGKTQWTYSAATGEVNITEPTNEELQLSNPYSAITNFKQNYKSSLLKSANKNEYAIKLTPRLKKGEIKECHLNISKSNLILNKIVIIMSNGTSFSSTISNYKSGGTFGNSIFDFNKKDVPSRTPIIDLR